MRSLYCLIWVATLKRVRITVEGWAVGQGGMVQRVGAEGMVQDIGRTREEEPHGVGQEGRRRGAVAVEVTLDRLDIVFAIPAGAIEVFVQHLGGGRLQAR